MTLAHHGLFALLIATAACLPRQSDAQSQVISYKGMCDASAGLALDAEHFVAANDERNKLQIFKRNQPDAVGSLDLSTFLGTAPKKESDLEGAAAIGNRIYWISSHGRNKDGEFQERRNRFFATDIKAGQPPSLTIVGDKPYTKLLDDLLAADQLKKYKLSEAAGRAPEAEGGLNIEGLAATPQGTLLIGFRNPIPQKSALVVPLQNPGEVLEGKNAKLGPPIELDLQGSGIRSIERVGSEYLVIAGPPADSGAFALYRWSGQDGAKPTPVNGVDLTGLRPEGVFAVANGMVQILSDDGSAKVEGKDCKDQDAAKQSFKSIVVKP